MSIQADIQWIQNELNKVEDPDLVEVFKRLLQFNRKKNYTIEDYNHEIAKAENDIVAGRVYSQEQIEKMNEEWKKLL